MTQAAPSPDAAPTIAAAAPADIPKDAKCCHKVWAGVFNPYPCGNKAKVVRDGKFYCGRHDPVAVNEKRAAKNAAWNAKFNASQQAAKDAKARQAALELDAARYRLLRRGQQWSVINGIGDVLRADDLDAAVDAEMQG
jgi:hypothetical protein